MSDPGPLTMRELWWRACGAWDRTVSLQLLVASALGGGQSPDAFRRLHPLRALEIPPPTEAEVRAEAEAGFLWLGAGLKAHHERHRG